LTVKEDIHKSIHEQVDVIIDLVDDPELQVKKAKLDRYLDKSSDIHCNSEDTHEVITKPTDTYDVLGKSQQLEINDVTHNETEELDTDITNLLIKCLKYDDYEHVLKLPNKVLLSILSDRPGNMAIVNIRNRENYQKMLMYIVRMHSSTNVRCAVLSLVEDEAFIVKIAFENLDASIRQTAADMIVEPQLLLKIYGRLWWRESLIQDCWSR